jgi:hypothetical protein
MPEGFVHPGELLGRSRGLNIFRTFWTEEVTWHFLYNPLLHFLPLSQNVRVWWLGASRHG